MPKLRVGIVGLGNIGRQHAHNFLSGQVARATLTAVATASPAKQAEFTPLCERVFASGEELLRARCVDAVLVATPHYSHLALGMAALENGLHLLVEKPIAAHKADAEKLIAAHAKTPALVFAGMFQKRAEPAFQKIRALLRSGALGQLTRVNWITTDWFRTHAYYASGGWRATWRGEGGGVLLNQALHNLDMLAWLVGQPTRVRGFCQLGKFHSIEVEDDVTAYLEWANGVTGTFITCTGEAPGTNRLELVGSLGKIVWENNQLTFTRNATDAHEFSRTAKEGFTKPAVMVETFSIADAPSAHAALAQNFVDAILDGTPLLAPGAEGIHSVELANAMVHSSLLGQTVELPLDGAVWERQLGELVKLGLPRR
ncbi:MAG: hypothetical protein RLZZ350_2662 [Verrucomicrobiota bacterium]|jgi:predicted dehydrogenase